MIRRYITSVSMVATMAFGSGSALASDTVSISETGADSEQIVEINNKSEVVTTNENNVSVVNINTQKAETGDVEVTKNTSIGGSIGSGNATNVNTTETAVSVSNGGHVDGGTVTPGSGGGGTVTPGSGGSVSVGSGAGNVPRGAGNVLGASTTSFGMGAGVETLPEVGAKFPVDVSAMRAAWNPNAAAPAELTKNSALFTNAMLITAALLSLIGAAGSVWYARRREERV